MAGGIIPLVLVEPWVGRRARTQGTRRYLTLGFGVLAAGALSFGLLGYEPALLLFMFAAINVGAALIEPLTDTHFFEVATEDEADRLFGIYNASAPVANLFGPLLGAVVFTVGFGLDGVWVASGLVLAGCVLVARRVRSRVVS